MKAHPPVFVNNLYSAKIPDKYTHDEEKRICFKSAGSRNVKSCAFFGAPESKPGAASRTDTSHRTARKPYWIRLIEALADSIRAEFMW